MTPDSLARLKAEKEKLEKKIASAAGRLGANVRKARARSLIALGATLTAGSPPGFSWGDDATMAAARAVRVLLAGCGSPASVLEVLAAATQIARGAPGWNEAEAVKTYRTLKSENGKSKPEGVTPTNVSSPNHAHSLIPARPSGSGNDVRPPEGGAGNDHP